VSSKPVKNIAASNRAKLLNLSRQSGRSFQELVQYFALSRFLYRLSVSPSGPRFILKEAMLLHSLNITEARSTLDIDLLARFDNSPESILKVMAEVIGQDVDDDGLEFIVDTLAISEITKEAGYVGRRVQFEGRLDTIRIPMQIDIGFGDNVYPDAGWVDTPSMPGYPSGQLKGYALETSSFSEIFSTFFKQFVEAYLLWRYNNSPVAVKKPDLTT
jgi:hypothetical protein